MDDGRAVTLATEVMLMMRRYVRQGMGDMAAYRLMTEFYPATMYQK